jgi:hypothetical protein
MSVSRITDVRTIVTAFAAVSIFGCSDPMESGSLVDELRILAVRADPPEIAPGAGTALTTLWADPKGGGRDVTFVWIAAAGQIDIASGFPCATPLAPPQIVTNGENGDHYEISTTPDDLIEQLAMTDETCAKITILVLACAGGTPPSADDFAQLGSLDLKSDLCRGGEGVVATKVVRVSRNEAPNMNPSIDSFAIAGLAIPQGQSEIQIPLCLPNTACKDVPLDAILAQSSFEAYPTSYVMPGATGYSDEVLYISWFATAGEFDNDRSASDSPEEPASNRLSLAVDDPDSLTLYIVAHDNRGGTSWTSIILFR